MRKQGIFQHYWSKTSNLILKQEKQDPRRQKKERLDNLTMIPAKTANSKQGDKKLYEMIQQLVGKKYTSSHRYWQGSGCTKRKITMFLHYSK